MDNPRPEKVAVIDEVRARLEDAQATVVTEYRGLTVADLAALRKSLTAAGGDYKVFKNTLVKRAIDGGAHAPLEDMLVGPTAIAFVHGDVSAVAKALRDFARTNTHLVVKGGLLDGALLSPAQLGALADLPSRDVLLSRLAGGFQAPLAQMASLFAALPRNLAYGLKALVDERGGVPSDAAEAVTPSVADADAAAVGESVTPEEAVTDEASTAAPEAVPAAQEPEAEAPHAEAPEAEAPEAEAPEAEAPEGEAPEAEAPEAEAPEAEAPEAEAPQAAAPEAEASESSPSEGDPEATAEGE